MEEKARVVQNGEIALIERCRKGDLEAFQEIMRQYTGLVTSVAYNIVGDRELARDLAQETFYKVYRNLSELEHPQTFKAWICKVARRVCIDSLRREKLKYKSLDHIMDEGIEPYGERIAYGSKTTTPEQEELHEKVLYVLGTLPRIYQEIVLLRHLRHYTYKELSEFLSIPTATVESRLYRARLQLKEKLKDLYDL